MHEWRDLQFKVDSERHFLRFLAKPLSGTVRTNAFSYFGILLDYGDYKTSYNSRFFSPERFFKELRNYCQQSYVCVRVRLNHQNLPLTKLIIIKSKIACNELNKEL